MRYNRKMSKRIWVEIRSVEIGSLVVPKGMPQMGEDLKGEGNRGELREIDLLLEDGYLCVTPMTLVEVRGRPTLLRPRQNFSPSS
jgi:hypothetical protein